MRVRRFVFATLVWCSAAAAANAGALIRAELDVTLIGIPFRTIAVGAVGNLNPAAARFTLEPGAVFSTSFCVGSAAAGCRGPATAILRPVTRAIFRIGTNGGIDGTFGQQTVPACNCDGIRGDVALIAKIGKAPTFTLLDIPLNLGVTETTYVAPTTPITSLPIPRTGFKDAWHLGPISLTGLTTESRAAADVRTTGGITVNAFGQTVISLVSLSRVRIRGLGHSTFAMPARLTLIYGSDSSATPSLWVCPEPTAPLLLGAAVAVLALGRGRFRIHGTPTRP